MSVASRFVALVLAALAFSGCASSPRGKMIGGGLMATTGVLLAAAPNADGHCSNHDGSWDENMSGSGLCDALITQPINDATNALTMGAGVAFMALGLAIFASGAVDYSKQAETTKSPLVVTTEQHVDAQPAVAVVDRTAGAPPAAIALATPAELALRSRLENRLAIQASLAAHRGYCSAAVITADELAKRDHDMYSQLLATDAELRACVDAAQRM